MGNGQRDSLIYSRLFGDEEIGSLISDRALIREMLRVEAALAGAQAELGTIPVESAEAIDAAAEALDISPSDLAVRTLRDGVPVPALVAALREAMKAAGEGRHAEFLHAGATSQDVMDTATVLCLGRILDVIEQRLSRLSAALAGAADANRNLVIAARTRNRIATPTTLGLRIAGWLAPLLRHRDRLNHLRPRLLVVSLAGASGNLSAFRGRGLETARMVAERLGIGVPDAPWHTARDGVAELASLLSLITGSLGKMSQDLLLSAQLDEGISAGSGGESSTMPHKVNPVLQETVVALARSNAADVAQVHAAMVHAQEREGSAWSQEIRVLPGMLVATGTALRHAIGLAASISVDEARLAESLAVTRGMMMAEAASFALSDHIGLARARDAVKSACEEAVRTGRPLRDVLEATADLQGGPDWNAVFDPANAVGEAGKIIDGILERVRT